MAKSHKTCMEQAEIIDTFGTYQYCSLIKARPGHGVPKNELLDIFYAGLIDESRSYLDSCVGCVFRERTPDDAEELMGKIGKNHEELSIPEPPPPPKKSA